MEATQDGPPVGGMQPRESSAVQNNGNPEDDPEGRSSFGGLYSQVKGQRLLRIAI